MCGRVEEGTKTGSESCRLLLENEKIKKLETNGRENKSCRDGDYPCDFGCHIRCTVSVVPQAGVEKIASEIEEKRAERGLGSDGFSKGNIEGSKKFEFPRDGNQLLIYLAGSPRGFQFCQKYQSLESQWK